MSNPKPAPLPPWGVAVAGATGAVIANAMVYPLDMSVAGDSCLTIANITTA